MKDLKFYIFIASALLIIYLVAEYNRPKPIDWSETYVNTDKIPYGTYVLYHQLHDIFPGTDIRSYKEPVYNVLADRKIGNANYLIICNSIKFIESDYEELRAFISKGNDVFIAASSFGTYLSDTLKLGTSPQFAFTKTVRGLKLMNKTLDTSHVYAIDKKIPTSYFDSFDTTRAIILGKDVNDHINFVKYNFGKGSLYLNTNPSMFSNYALLNTNGGDYASTALSYLHPNKNLIWDEYYTLGKDDEGSPMRVFLRNPALRMAYYIALFALLIYVVYQIKRRQRIIPVIEPLQNTTLDFVNVVGQVYYEQRDNSNIAQKKASYFLEHLRTQYNLKTNLLNNEFVEMLAHKSGVDTQLIQQLLHQVTLVRSGAPVSDTELIDLNKNIERFYQRSK